MDFSLSSSLVGSTVLNPDKLALDLQFAADKTLTARKGPTPVFTRASTGRFVGSNGLIQSAAINTPRFDHDPVTGVCKGLLMEESRTNICLQSENFGTNWSGTGRTISLNAATAPDGSTTADKIVEGTNNGLHGVFQTLSTVSGSTYIGSMYVKAAGRNFATIYTGASPTNGRYISIPADGTGTVLGLFNANPSTVTMRYVGDGWYLVTILIVASATGTSLEMYPALTATVNSYTGDGTSGILVWGAQVELGSFPTSYIPTTTASVVRSADVCSIDSSNFASIWNGVDMTVFFKGSRIDNKTGQVNWELTSGTSATSIASDRGTTTERITANAVGIMQISAFTTLTEYKIAAALKAGDYAVSFNGAAAISSSNAFVLTLNRMTIGMNRVAASTLNGCIHSIQSYKKRLPNAKLQTLTV